MTTSTFDHYHVHIIYHIIIVVVLSLEYWLGKTEKTKISSIGEGVLLIFGLIVLQLLLMFKKEKKDDKS